MSTAAPPFDVFVSYSSRDHELAADVAQRLKAEGLQPFFDGGIPTGHDISDAIWDALAECHAFICIVPGESGPDAMGMVELGAATAWNKPIFLVLNGSATSRLPVALESFRVYPPNRLDEVFTSIKRSLEPVSDDDRRIVAETYSDMGVPVDQLSQSAKELKKFVSRFRSKAGKQISGTRLLSELMRLRKQGKLSRLKKTRRLAN